MPLAPNETLRELRRARGLTQQKLADLIQVSRSTERRWEHGHIQRPHIGQLKNLAHALGVSMDELGFGSINPTIIESINLVGDPFAGSAMSRALAVLCDDEQVQRRSFTLLTGTALMEPVTRYLAAPPSSLNESSGAGRRITDEFVDGLDAVNSRLRVMDDWVGGQRLLQVAHGQTRLVSDVLNNSSYTAQVGRRLHANIADLLRISAYVSFDVGRYAQAQQLWITALRAAHLAGDHALAANILGWMSDGATQIEAGNAVPLAQAALTAYRGNDPKVRAILQLQAAKAYGYSHDLTACRRTIDAAFDSLSKVGHGDHPPEWAYWIGERAIHTRAAGFSYYAMGKWPQAERHLQTALELRDPNQMRDHALCYTMLATTQLHRRDVEQACSNAHQTIDLFGGRIESAQCMRELNRFTCQLGCYRANPVARDFIERVRSLTVAAV